MFVCLCVGRGQVVVSWAGALGGAGGARVAAARGLAHLTQRWATHAQRYALFLKRPFKCHNLIPITVSLKKPKSWNSVVGTF